MKQKPEKLIVGPCTRSMQVAECEVRKQDDGTKRFKFSLSSEYEVDRGWGFGEVLSHDADAIRLDRASSGAMPLLFNHNSDDPVGMVDSASIRGKKLIVEGAFFATQRAQDVATMVEGGLRNVSVGYRIHCIEDDKDTDIMTVTDWEPYEASIAPVPADPTVGVGRSQPGEEREVVVKRRSIAAPANPPDPPTDKTIQEDSEARTTRASEHLDERISQAPQEGNDMTAASAGSAGDKGAGASAAGGDNVRVTAGDPPPDAIAMEKSRVRAIENMCKACNMDEGLQNRWITSGMGVDQVSEEVMRIQVERGKKNPQNNLAHLDLSAGDRQRFSVVKAIRAIADNGNWKDAGFEAACSQEISVRLGKVPDSKRFYVPYDVQQRGIDSRAIASQQRALSMQGVSPLAQRDVYAAAAASGGYLVETDNVGFIELLRNRAVAYRLGATQLSGLVGNVNVPKQSAAGTAYWLGSETANATESQQTFGQLALSPHTVAAYTEMSRQLLLQSSPGVEGIVNADLAAIAALALDSGVLSGSGSAGQPTGISNVSGVGSVSGSDVTAIAYTGQLKFQTALANANVMPSRAAYATTPAVAAFMMGKTRFANTNTPLWDGNLWDANGALGVAGFPGMSSNQIASQNIYFGDWASIIVAEWGVLEIEVNPYAGFQAGIVGIRAMMTVDVGLRYPAAFAVSSTTTS